MFCTQCGKQANDIDKFCCACGVQLPEPMKPTISASAYGQFSFGEQSTSAVNHTKITCPHCGYLRQVPSERIPANATKVSCPKCRKWFTIGAPEQTPVRTPQSPPADPEFKPVNKTGSATNQVRPWVRYWARMFDVYSFSLVSGLILAIIAPKFLEAQNEFVLGMILVFVWVFVEALLLSSFQTTPGKWLFKTKIALNSGMPINFSQALARSFKVWWRGFGTGFPIASMITMIIAHGRLARNGVTSWDKEDEFSVAHEIVGVPRVLAAIVFFSMALFFMALAKTG